MGGFRRTKREKAKIAYEINYRRDDGQGISVLTPGVRVLVRGGENCGVAAAAVVG